VEKQVAAEIMRKVWCVADSIVSPLGSTSEENYARIREGESAIHEYTFPTTPGQKYWLAKILNQPSGENRTFFDELCLRACEKAIQGVKLPPQKTLLVLSTTKGNIDLLAKENQAPGLYLYSTAKKLAAHLGVKDFQVVSNACISGVLALIIAKRFINTGKYDHAVVVGADVISEFIVSGFQSLLALSNEPCRPFDKNRSGINLGEAAAAMIISADPDGLGVKASICLTGEGVNNDANHISGPSRTGAELAMTINHALASAHAEPGEIDFVSAHGTATLFNDEMEAKAFNLCGLQQVPVNSLKSYYGHTLGAAGVLESVISIHSLMNDEIIGTKEFETLGVSQPLNVVAKTQSKPLRKIVKTASGFGGCNAAVVFEKVIE
jgi:3-oxoacyl-[acyl-carrier-protein] synthase I